MRRDRCFSSAHRQNPVFIAALWIESTPRYHTSHPIFYLPKKSFRNFCWTLLVNVGCGLLSATEYLIELLLHARFIHNGYDYLCVLYLEYMMSSLCLMRYFIFWPWLQSPLDKFKTCQYIFFYFYFYPKYWCLIQLTIIKLLINALMNPEVFLPFVQTFMCGLHKQYVNLNKGFSLLKNSSINTKQNHFKNVNILMSAQVPDRFKVSTNKNVTEERQILHHLNPATSHSAQNQCICKLFFTLLSKVHILTWWSLLNLKYILNNSNTQILKISSATYYLSLWCV